MGPRFVDSPPTGKVTTVVDSATFGVTLANHLRQVESRITSYYHTTMAKVIVTFKLEEDIYTKLKAGSQE